MRTDEATRERRPRACGRRWLPFVSGAAGLGLAIILFLYGASERKLAELHAVPASDLILEVGVEDARPNRGRHLATVVAQCPFCHGTDLGGREMADDPWIGRLDSANLTAGKGGVARDYTREDWIRAIRFGVGREGRSLLLMPSGHLSAISDSDLLSLIAYLEGVPPVDREPRPFRVGWLTRLALATGQAADLLAAASVDRSSIGPASVAEARSAEYGRYLVDLGSCRICHHADLRGGLHPLALPGEPPPPDLRSSGAIAHWTREDFDRAMRTGQTPDGRLLDREFMPWPLFAGLAPLEIDALWLYLKSSSI